MMQFRPEVLEVTESPLVRIATAAEQVPGSLRLCYGESDMPTPEFICRAAYEASLSGHTFYTNPGGSDRLLEAVAVKFEQLHGVRYRPSEIIATVGAGMAIFLAIRTLVGPGDNAVVICPAYSIFASGVTMAGGETRLVPLVRDGDAFRIDLDRIHEAIDDHTSLLALNSPSNPTGWVITREEQEALWELALRNDFVILSDEVYDRLVFGPPVAPSFATVATDREHLLVVNSFSKSYNMTGWRLGYGLGSERMIGLMTTAAEFMTSSAPAMVQEAGVVALEQGDSYVAELRELYSKRRRLVMDRIAELPRVSLPSPEGGFYGFLQIDELTDSATFAEELVRRTGVALAPGSAFGPGGEGYLRLCFAARDETLDAALDRFGDFMRRRN